MRQKALQQKLRSGLMSLPEPQYTYEIEVPEVLTTLGFGFLVPWGLLWVPAAIQ